MNRKRLFILNSLVTLQLLAAGLTPRALHAETPDWSQCPDSSEIVRCETYNCPQGDTNQDGACTVNDTGASLSDARNDSLCANPPSGCGEVRYYPTSSNIACGIRVKESGDNCSLYSAGNPDFSTPSPTPSATFAPAATLPPTTAASTTKGGETLPETGPELFITLSLIATGLFGLYLYDARRPA